MKFYENLKQNFGLLSLALFVSGTSFLIIWYLGRELMNYPIEEKEEATTKTKKSKLVDPIPTEESTKDLEDLETGKKASPIDLESFIADNGSEETERLRDEGGKFQKSSS